MHEPLKLPMKLPELPEDVQDSIGHALDLAQRGDTADYAKPLHGYGADVWEKG